MLCTMFTTEAILEIIDYIILIYKFGKSSMY